MSETQTIILCPGQGAQHVGMGHGWDEKFPIAHELLEGADSILGLPLRDLCFYGPKEELSRTDIAQPAIFATSVACFSALEEQETITSFAATAGLSLGEFTALHLAGAFSFEDGLKLVRKRGQFMQEAALASRGKMVVLIGADETQATQICEQALAKVGSAGEVLVPANFNCPGQIVLSGSEAACLAAIDLAAAAAIRSTLLDVAGAFHSPLMASAAERLRAALDEVAWSAPQCTVYSNVTAQPHEVSDIASIKQRLVEQLTSPVRWEQSMVNLVNGLQGAASPPRVIELAPGKVLMGLMRKIDRNVRVENFADPA